MIEKMKQWLEALEESCGDRCNAEYNPCHARTAITSLRQAIEHAEKQEHAEQLAKQGWQYFECPACGSEGAKGFPKPVQEPMAWVNWCAATGKRSVSFECESELASQPLYTTPQPQREWVGLTDEEKRSVCRVGPVYAPDGVVTRNPLEYRKELEGIALMAVRQAEAKLKEKNT